MPLNEKGQCFTVLKRAAGGLATGKMMNVLKFTVKEIDPSSGEAEEEGYEDEYQVRPPGDSVVCTWQRARWPLTFWSIPLMFGTKHIVS
jgi:hypothetical protein